MAHSTNSLSGPLRAELRRSHRNEVQLRRDCVMEEPGSFLRKASDAWEKQNDTRNQRAHNLNCCVRAYERIPRGKSSHREHDICARHEESEVLSGLVNRSFQFSEKQAGALPRHSGDECWHGAAWYETLGENTKFIYKTGDHKSPAVRQRFQGVSHDILGRLVNEAKLSMAVFRFPAVAVGKNPAGAERDHTHSARTKFFLKPQRKTC